MLVCRREDRAILGFFNLSQITRGSLQSAYLGYAVASKFANQGYMREGLDLVVREAFATLRLHRIEANIQPGNQASIALARGAGFVREGFSPAVPEDRRPLARPRALGDPGRGLARATQRSRARQLAPSVG